MRVYVASRALPERTAMWRELRAAGEVEVVSSWIDQTGKGESDYGELWPAIVYEISTAFAVILYAEQDDFPLKGALVEVGAVLAFNRLVYVVTPGVELEPRSFRPLGSWVNHPRVFRCGSLADAVCRIRTGVAL